MNTEHEIKGRIQWHPIATEFYKFPHAPSIRTSIWTSESKGSTVCEVKGLAAFELDKISEVSVTIASHPNLNLTIHKDSVLLIGVYPRVIGTIQVIES